VDPEKATSYEVGIKSSWMDNRLTANAALFVIDYEDLQVQVWDPSIGFGVSVWGNAAKVGSQGLELETVFQATENLQLAAAVGYVDATYDVFPGVALPEGEGAPGDDNDGLIDAKTDASGNQVPIAPKWNANVTASHQYPLKNGGSLVTRIEYTYKGDRFSDQGSANTPGDELPSYSLVNLRLGYNPEAANWSVNLWARNLTNTQKAEESRYFNFVGARQTKRYMTPRTYGVSFNYDF
jgi:iron complex outermembrane receptor protein